MDRFWLKVEKTESCWLWIASINSDGYGQYWFEGTMAKAHIICYNMLIGQVPKDYELDHTCRVRRCVNPDHLEVVTHKVNTLRGISIPALNAQKTHCKRGHPLSGSNLYVNPSKNGFRVCLACKKNSRLGVA